MTLQMCLQQSHHNTNEISKFYNRSLLCSIAEKGSPRIVSSPVLKPLPRTLLPFSLSPFQGSTSGFLLCEKRLTGILITKNWRFPTVANFTNVGVYANWLVSRVSDVRFPPMKFNFSEKTGPDRFLSYIILSIYFLFRLLPYNSHFGVEIRVF